MRTTYLTAFDPATLQCTGPSVPAGFDSVAEAVQFTPDTPVRHSERTAVYDGYVITDYVLRLEP